MALLQRISRNILTCGIIPSSWLRKIGKRKLIKLFVVGFLLYLLLVLIKRRSQSMVILPNHLQINSLYGKAVQRLPGNNVKPQANVLNIKEDPPSRHLMGKRPRCLTQPETLLGPLTIYTNITPSYEEVINQSDPDLMSGGCYRPTNCKPLQKVAVIIPFKDRDAHLKALLYYLHPILQRQQSSYCIYVGEQFDNGQFNKAMVMNAAFEEVMKRDAYDCIIFHDVDMIPEDDRNMYMCGSQPRHLSPAIDKFNYAPRYGTDFGGVTAISPQQYRKANGHSNQFWGWGGEDNDMEFRIFYSEMRIVPSPMKVGRYKMIRHKHPWQFSPNKFPWRLNKTREARAETDGLSDLQYRMVSTDLQPTYTKLMIDIRKLEVKRVTLFVDGVPTMDVDVKPGPCRWEEYEGKYLDFSIELSDIPEAADFRIPQKVVKHSPVPDTVNIKIPPPPEEEKSTRFSMVEKFADALNLCETLAPECQGILRENRDGYYSLRKSNMPRHIVVTSARANPQGKTRFYFPNKAAFVKYCPGDSGDFQWLTKPLMLNPDLHQNITQHRYSIQVHFAVLLQPPEFLYYRDHKFFEAQQSKGENYYTFNWANRKKLDFSNPETPREFTVKSADFTIANIPGCYSVESKIQDKLNQPYFQWNWWFEVTTGDREKDAEIREQSWKQMMQENAVARENAKVSQRAAMQAKREAEFQRQMAKIHKTDLERQKKTAGDVVMENNYNANTEDYADKENDDNDEHFGKKWRKLSLDEQIEVEKEILSDTKNAGQIEIYDAKKSLAPIKQIKPTISLKPARVKAFHVGLPKHK